MVACRRTAEGVELGNAAMPSQSAGNGGIGAFWIYLSKASLRWNGFACRRWRPRLIKGLRGMPSWTACCQALLSPSSIAMKQEQPPSIPIFHCLCLLHFGLHCGWKGIFQSKQPCLSGQIVACRQVDLIPLLAGEHDVACLGRGLNALRLGGAYHCLGLARDTQHPRNRDRG